MSRKQFVALVLCTILCSFAGGMVAVGLFNTTPVNAQQMLSFTAKEFKLPEGHFIGIVEKGKLLIIAPRPPMQIPVRLTTIQMQEARAVEGGEIDLTPFEGNAVMITGYNGGPWIYNAVIKDKGGPLLTILVKKIFTK